MVGHELRSAIRHLWAKAVFGVERFRAIAAFKRREAKRERLRYPIVWRNHLQLVAADLALVHEAEPELITATLIDELSNARAEIASSTAKFSTAIMAASAYLVFTTLDIEIPISFAGLTLTPSPGVAEVVALSVATLSAVVAAKAVTSMTLVVASKKIILLLYPNELYAIKIMQFHANEPPPFYRPSLGSLTWSKATLIANLAHLLMMVGTLAAVIGLSIGWRWLVYPELWENPSADPFWCQIAMITTIVVDIGWVSFMVFYLIPFPHKDYAWLYALNAVDEMPGWEWLARQMRADSYGEGWKDRAEMQRKSYLPPDPKETDKHG